MKLLVPDHFLLYIGILNFFLFLFACYPVIKYKSSFTKKCTCILIAFCLPIIGSMIVVLINILDRKKIIPENQG